MQLPAGYHHHHSHPHHHRQVPRSLQLWLLVLLPGGEERLGEHQDTHCQVWRDHDHGDGDGDDGG